MAVWVGSPSFRGWAHWTSASLTEIQDGSGPCGHQPGAACTRPVGEETQSRAWIGSGLTVVGCERVQGVGRGPGIPSPRLQTTDTPQTNCKLGWHSLAWCSLVESKRTFRRRSVPGGQGRRDGARSGASLWGSQRGLSSQWPQASCLVGSWPLRHRNREAS